MGDLVIVLSGLKDSLVLSYSIFFFKIEFSIYSILLFLIGFGRRS